MSGPKIDPCGTAALTVCRSAKEPFAKTLCFLFMVVHCKCPAHYVTGL